jgi:DNA invertase Pin-like site-specific DNA recombinase
MVNVKEPNVTKGKRRAGQMVGYLRVSALDQKELRQLDGITVAKRFTDKASGKDMHRPQLQLLLEYVRDGDTVVCHAMDRLARNLDDLRKIVLGLTERGVHVRFEKENLIFTGTDSPMSHLLLSVMGAFAQFERDLIRERQREGIALAKLREGAYVGRKHSLTPLQAKDLSRRANLGESKTKLAAEFGISRQTLYRYIAGEGN